MRLRVIVWVLLLLVVGLLAWQLYGVPHASKSNAIPAVNRTPIMAVVKWVP